jgi:hypothetical protein
MQCSRSDTFLSGSNAFGKCSVSGISRVPFPAARIIAFMYRIFVYFGFLIRHCDNSDRVSSLQIQTFDTPYGFKIA